MALLVNMHHIFMAEIDARVQYEWVPSLANIADWPTRADKLHLIPSDAVWLDIVLPDAASFSGAFQAWAALALAAQA